MGFNSGFKGLRLLSLVVSVFTATFNVKKLHFYCVYPFRCFRTVGKYYFSIQHLLNGLSTGGTVF